MTTQPNTPEQPKREAVEGLNAELNFFAEAMFEAGMASGAKVSDAYSRSDACKQDAETIRRNIHSLVSVALSTQAEELERAIADKEAMQEERNDAQSMLDDTRKELDRVKGERESPEGLIEVKDNIIANEQAKQKQMTLAIGKLQEKVLEQDEELDRVKAELAAVRDELSDMEFEAANLTDGADWQERSMRLKHRVSLLGGKLDALLK